ncbi:hypothetical protein BC830DRAFT_269454 [Chytriomyces sp. MP71]|nr:hypothetical protein BC830DRAFT_269454 [Chytriomyces sp. MP71]
MEERLVALKETLSKQKEKRGTTESIWKGGNLQRGSLKSYADDVLLAKKLAKERQKQANLRYSGISDEAATQLRSFEDEVAARLMKLQSLHSQSTGHAGLPSDLSLIVKPASKLDAGSQSNVEKPLKKYGDTKLANEAFKNEKDETIIEKANTPVPPKETPKMIQKMTHPLMNRCIPRKMTTMKAPQSLTTKWGNHFFLLSSHGLPPQQPRLRCLHPRISPMDLQQHHSAFAGVDFATSRRHLSLKKWKKSSPNFIILQMENLTRRSRTIRLCKRSMHGEKTCKSLRLRKMEGNFLTENTMSRSQEAHF